MKRDVYQRLAEVEDRHTVIWEEVITKNGGRVGTFRPAGRTRLLAWLGRRFGPGFLLPMLIAEEGREVKGYLDLHRETPKGAAGGDEALLLARESKEHANTISGLAGRVGEPWHATASGGLLRNVIYGFNDGLTANFGLVAGVIGATALAQERAIIVAGVAGLIADSLSMGASGYLAAKSEQEVYAHEIAMEKDEIALMPEVERDELALIYEAKGMHRDAAHALATEVMADPARMLKEQVQEELKIGGPRRVTAARRLDHGHGDGDRCAHSGVSVLHLARRHRDLAVVQPRDGEPLPGRRGAQRVHRPRRVPLGARHVRRRRGCGGGGLLRRRVGGAADRVTTIAEPRKPPDQLLLLQVSDPDVPEPHRMLVILQPER